MKKQWITILLTGAFASSLHANCSNMPIGTELAKSIMAKDLDNAKKHLADYDKAVAKFLTGCKDEGADQQVNIMLLTYKDKVSDLEADLKKGSETAYDCSIVPDDAALNSAFASGDAAKIKSTYETYSKQAADYLEHCAAHEEYEFVFEASLLHEEEYANHQKK